MQKPFVSVIIPTFNGARFINETIESALAQTYDNYEVIVIDDGSTDDTVARVERFGNRIRFLQKDNGGPASARNYGIERAHGSLIALLDHDDLWLPERLALQVDFLEQHPEVALVYADAYLLETGNANSARTCFEIDPPQRGMVFDKLLARNFIPNLTVLVRRTIFDEFGLFDASGNILTSDDYHKWLQVTLHYPIDYIAQPLGSFRRHGHNFSNDMAAIVRAAMHSMEDIFTRYPEQTAPHAGLRRQVEADLHYRLARWHQQQGRHGAARLAAKTALAANPVFWRAGLAYAYSLLHPNRSQP